MDNVVRKNLFDNLELETPVKIEFDGKRPRNLTVLKMQWLAQRVRKIEAIRKQVEDGSYHVDSTLVAKAILFLD